jgi:hypothetical protein
MAMDDRATCKIRVRAQLKPLDGQAALIADVAGCSKKKAAALLKKGGDVFCGTCEEADALSARLLAAGVTHMKIGVA